MSVASFCRRPPALSVLVLALAGLSCSLSARAADLTFSGQLAVHNELVHIDLDVDAATTVRLWTDSWRGGLNVDPQLALWRDGVWLAGNDDDATIGSGQGYYDAGLLIQLDAGHYRLVLSAAGNDPVGATLAEGYTLSAQAPIPLADWTQPSSDINVGDQKGGFWQVHVDGVTQASVVPEPSAALLLAFGLLPLALRQRRSSRARRRPDPRHRAE